MMSRVARLTDALIASDVDALAVTPGPSMVYLTGLHFHVSERPIVALFFPDRPAQIVLPELEETKALSGSVEFEVFSYGEDEPDRQKAFEKAVDAAGLAGKTVGVEPLRFRYLESMLVQVAIGGGSIVAADELISPLRMIKDENEIASIQKAVDITQDALEQTMPLIQVGMTENDLASELSLQLLRAGSQPEIPFSPIVATGSNSALPHAFPGDRKLEAGDLLIIDCGATYESYIADLTRTFAVSEPQTQFVEIYNLVLKANQRGRVIAAPGVECQEVDQASRAVIDTAGFGDFFMHRTGHGIGLESHEGPYIRAGNARQLVPGMTFTVEPGIYLRGQGGVRIEDNLVITSSNSRSLSSFSRELQVVG
jgi:Xaa-Pro dipeptidase